MTLKVIYLNNGWRYYYGVSNISKGEYGFKVEFDNGETIYIDSRLKLELSWS